MPRPASAQSIESIIGEAIAGVVARAVKAIQNDIAVQVAAELKRAAPRSSRVPSGSRRGRAGIARRAARAEITKWVADNRARRVPNFVIEATGLDTKKKIVAKYGEATFEKGKPLPSAKAVKAETAKLSGPGATPTKAARVVKAAAPVVRKAAAAKK